MATHSGPASRRPTGPYSMHLRIGLPGASVGAATRSITFMTEVAYHCPP
jgi:hypothetical protein